MENQNEMVCYCSSITKEELLKAIQNGASSLSDIRIMTGACTVGNCMQMNPSKRCCSNEIRKLLEHDFN